MKVAFLTAGGLAPCLSSSLGRLIQNYSKKRKDIKFLGYLNGYKGLLLGNKIKLSNSAINSIAGTYLFGGTFLGNSRVQLSNVEDCLKNGYIKKGQVPLEIAANQLIKDKVDILSRGDDY